jgi:hypothetical protein
MSRRRLKVPKQDANAWFCNGLRLLDGARMALSVIRKDGLITNILLGCSSEWFLLARRKNGDTQDLIKKLGESYPRST